MSFFLLAAIPAIIIFFLFYRKNKTNWPLKLIGSYILGIVIIYIVFIIFASITGYHG